MYKPKIFFTAAYSGKKLYQKYYDQIVAAIQQNDVELVATELGNYKSVLTTQDKQSVSTAREEHYLAIKKGIKWADLVILELSQESFQVGHEATLALQEKKPVLGLSLHEDWSKRIVNKYFHGVKYSQYFVAETITSFINKYRKEPLNERFNLFMSASQLAKLERLANQSDMNSSEYLRSLIEEK